MGIIWLKFVYIFDFVVDIHSQWNMQLEKVFELEDLSRNAGSSDRYLVILAIFYSSLC